MQDYELKTPAYSSIKLGKNNMRPKADLSTIDPEG
jgi:hypothetical protein